MYAHSRVRQSILWGGIVVGGFSTLGQWVGGVGFPNILLAALLNFSTWSVIGFVFSSSYRYLKLSPRFEWLGIISSFFLVAFIVFLNGIIIQIIDRINNPEILTPVPILLPHEIYLTQMATESK